MIYFFIVLFLLFLTCKYELRNAGTKSVHTKWIPFILFIFVLVGGFRDGLGVDTKQYVDFFKYVPTIDNLSSSYFDYTRFRPGFVIFYSMCKYVINDITLAFVLESLFVNFVVLLFIKKHTEFPYLAILLYFLINFLEFNMEIQREAISVALVLLAWSKFENQKYIHSILLFVVATTFHISALIAIFFPFLNYIQFNNKWIVTAVASVFIVPVIFFAIPNLDIIIELLLNSDNSSVVDNYKAQSFNSNLNINYFLVNLINYIIIAYSLYNLKCKGRNRYAGYLLLFGTLMYMTSVSYAFYRFTNYLTIFYILVLTDFLMYFIRTHKIAKSAPKLILIFFLIYITYYHESKLLIFDYENDEYAYERYFPYKSVIFN